MKKTIYRIEITQTGDLIDTADSLEEAEEIIEDFEKEDFEKGDFEKDIYSIYKIENNKSFLYLGGGSWELY